MAEPIADVCLIGTGPVGGILAKELGTAGLKVVAFERGAALTLEDYAVRDAIKFITRGALLEWARHDPVTFRDSPTGRAVPTYPLINGLGGQMLHWGAQAQRLMPGDFKVFSREIATGVAERANADLAGYEVFDWPLSYDDLEPYHERFEWEFGVSGSDAVNPFAGRRKRGYPMPPLRQSAKMQLFEAACRGLGYHPYVIGAGVLSQPYRPPAPYDARIEERPACTYCAHCSEYGCHVHAKAAALYTVIPVVAKMGNVDLKTNCKVIRINTDSAGRATGVSYFTPDRRIAEQRAKVVILCGYAFENVRLLLMSESKGKSLANSSGAVGKGIFGNGEVRTEGIFDDYIVNSFIGPVSAAVRMDDFNGNNFDHTGLGFIRGAWTGTGGDGTPVQRYDMMPPGTPRWGKEYKDLLAHAYTRTLEIVLSTETLAHRDNFCDLDPDVRDEWDIPVPRVTFSFHQNERRMYAYMEKIGEGIMRAAGASTRWSEPKKRASRWAGGTRMGSDPRTSVVDGYGQAHDVPNLFVMGASTFPTLTAYPATATIGALAYRTADYIAKQHEWFR